MTLIFCLLHLFVGAWKRLSAHPSLWLASICLSVASSIFSFSFETWMVLEHEKVRSFTHFSFFICDNLFRNIGLHMCNWVNDACNT